MAGKSNAAPRVPTIEDRSKLDAQISRWAREWAKRWPDDNWTESDVRAYCLRMGVNRRMALERYEAKNADAAPKRAAKRTKPGKAA